MPLNPILQTAANGAQPAPMNPNMSAIVGSAIPGFGGLTSSATDVIRNLLSGQPSTGTTKRANAYFGAASGVPGSDFVRNRGFDLYSDKGEQYQQRGIQDLLSLLSGYSGTAMPTAGQAIQQQQFGQEFGFKQGQTALENAMRNREFDERQRLAREEMTPWYLRDTSQKQNAKFGNIAGIGMGRTGGPTVGAGINLW